MRLAISIAMFCGASTVAWAQPGLVDEAQHDPAEPRASPEHDRVRIDVGVSLLQRMLSFQSRAYSQQPPRFASNAMAMRVVGELYPLAERASPIAGLGIAGDLDEALGLGVRQAAEPDMRVDADQHAWSIGARYRWTPRGEAMPTVVFALDFSHRVFAVDRRATGMVVDLPDVDYEAIEPGVDARVPITRAISLLSGVRATLLRSAGAITDGNSYGRAHTVGFRTTTGLDVVLGARAAIRVSAEVDRLGMAFYGTGKLATSRDGDPTTIDVGGASDSSYRTSATVALFY